MRLLLGFNFFIFSFLSALLSPSLQAQAPARITAPVDDAVRVTLRGNLPRQTLHAEDRGEVTPAMPLHRMLLVLKPSDERETALRTLLADQQDSSSPSYHQWLSPAQFRAQFAPAEADRQAITQWLQANSFTVEGISNAGTVIEFSGSAAAVKQAFHTAIHRYSLQGEAHYANAAEPQIPAALADVVAGVSSLNNFQKQSGVRKLGTANRIGQTSTWQPQFTLNFGNPPAHYLAPGDFTKIYATAPLYANGIDGTGQTVAIVGRSNINLSDAQLFRIAFGLPPNDPRIILNGPDPGDFQGGSDETEADLDVEWAGAIAPKATIDFVVSASTDTTDGVDLSSLYIVDNNLAPVMSTSYGACEAELGSAGRTFYNNLWQQAAAQGITVVVASGDSGAAGCDYPGSGVPAAQGPAVDGIASSPYAIAVGGTQFNENGQDSSYWSAQNGPDQSSVLGYIPEQAWNESCGDLAQCGFINLYSSGGGPSAVYTKPPWQSGPGVPQDGKRDLPDISLAAAAQHDGYLLCQGGACLTDGTGALVQAYVVGGTSAAAPVFAAVMALVNQKTGARQGQADYVLYPLASRQAASCNASAPPAAGCIFNDITAGNNTVPGQTGYNAGPGYDLATGLGSINANNLVNGWGRVAFRPTTTQLQVSSAQSTHGQPINISIAVTGSGGTPAGPVSLLAGTGSATPLGQLSNGSFTGALASLPGGAYALTAAYGGDGTYGASMSNAVPLTVTPEAATTAFSIVSFTGQPSPVPVSSIAYSQGVYFQVAVAGTSHQGRATGAVTFTDTINGVSSKLSSTTLNSQGVLLVYNDRLAIGTHSIVASYSGDASFTASASAPVSITVAKGASQTFLFFPSGAPPNQPVTLQAIAAANGDGTPSGTVQFYNGTTPLGGPVTLNRQVATTTTSQLVAGANSITATYSGDAYFAGSTSEPASVFIGAPDFLLGINPGNLAATAAAPGQATLLLSPGPGLGYAGDVSFACSGLPKGASCAFSPATVTLNGFTTASTQVTISKGKTQAALRSRARNQLPGLPVHPSTVLGGMSLAGAVLLLWPGRRRISSLSVCAFLLSGAALCTGCGGGASAGTPSNPAPGNANIVTITATGNGFGGPATTHTVTLAVTFQ